MTKILWLILIAITFILLIVLLLIPTDETTHGQTRDIDRSELPWQR